MPVSSVNATSVAQPVIRWFWFIRCDIASPVGTKRWTSAPSDLTIDVSDGAGSQSWSATESPISYIGGLSQGDTEIMGVAQVWFTNIGVAGAAPLWSAYAANPGVRNARVRIWRVWLNADDTKDFATLRYDGKIGQHEIGAFAKLSLAPHDEWAREVPYMTPLYLGAGSLFPTPGIDRPNGALPIING